MISELPVAPQGTAAKFVRERSWQSLIVLLF
jgi:hypothetical protein